MSCLSTQLELAPYHLLLRNQTNQHISDNDNANIHSCHPSQSPPHPQTLPASNQGSESKHRASKPTTPTYHPPICAKCTSATFPSLITTEIRYPQPPDDVRAVHGLLSQLLVNWGKRVLLIKHWAGAFTATMLQAKTREARGAWGGVIGLFYESGFMIPMGESVRGFFQPKDASEAVIPPYNILPIPRESIRFLDLLSSTSG